MLDLELTDAGTDLVSVTLVAFAWVQRSLRAFVALQINGEVAKDAHRQLTDFPTDFHRHVENEQAVDAGLICGHRRGVTQRWFAAAEMNIKAVPTAGVVVEGRRKLRVNRFRKIDPRADLPREQECISVWNQLIPPDSAGL